jgi:hypothetical protein
MGVTFTIFPPSGNVGFLKDLLTSNATAGASILQHCQSDEVDNYSGPQGLRIRVVLEGRRPILSVPLIESAMLYDDLFSRH